MQKVSKRTLLYTTSGMYAECAAIRSMGLPSVHHAHQRDRVMVYMDNFFIPKERPNPEVPTDQKITVNLRKTQPCKVVKGNILPRVIKRENC